MNQTASAIWLGAIDGLTPEEIASELADLLPEADETIERDVRAALAEWVEAGLLQEAGPG